MSAHEGRILDLLAAVIDLAERERRVRLEALCGADHSLLEAVLSRLNAAEAPLFAALDEPAPGVPTGDPLIGSVVDGYRITAKIGEGRTAAVYLAEHAYRARTALKVRHRPLPADAGPPKLSRADDVLTALDDPHLAALYGVGMMPDGRPYRAQEWVEGVGLTAYCRAHLPGVAARLALFRRVCAAVATAHAHQVVHGNLKPANIMVTADGTPKLMDFGTAAPPYVDTVPTVPHTRAGYQWATPDYAGPEQVAGRESTASTDIYALGVLLYQLLTGRLPAPPGLGRRPLPPRPSRVAAAARRDNPHDGDVPRWDIAAPRDLDLIVRMSLRVQPGARYPTATALAEDLDRLLAGRPVSAHADAPLHHLVAFFRRKRLALTVAVPAIGLMLGLPLYQAAHTRARLQHTEAALAQARAAVAEAREEARLLMAVFAGADPDHDAGADTPARVLLDRVTVGSRLHRSASPAQAAQTYGAAYAHLGAYDTARRLLCDALLALPAHAPASAQAEARYRLADLALRAGLPADAAAYAADALSHLGPDTAPAVQAACLLVQGRAAMAEGRPEAALPPLWQARSLCGQHPEVPQETAVRVADTLGACLLHTDGPEAAHPLLQEALTGYDALYGRNHARGAGVLAHLARVAQQQGDAAGAEAALLERLAILERVLAPTHPALLDAPADLAAWYLSQGRMADALAFYERARLPADAGPLGAHHRLGTVLLGLGTAYRRLGDLDAAEAVLQRAHAATEAPGHWDATVAADVLYQLGLCRVDAGRYAEAEVFLRRALNGATDTPGGIPSRPALILDALGSLYVQRGEYARAVVHRRRALDLWFADGGLDHPRAAATRATLDRALEALNGELPPATPNR